MIFPSSPISFAFEITFQCVNSCPACANAWTSKHDLYMRDWQGLLDKIAPPDNRKRYAELIRVTGGEPTLHREFSEIIEHIDTFGIPHAIFTSGRWKNPEEIIGVYKKCSNFIGMLISLHGAAKSAHNAFVGDSATAFDEACENIRIASEAGIDVFTNTVLTKHACGQIQEIIDLSKRLGAKYAVFNRLLGAPHPIEAAEDELKNAVSLIEKLGKEGVSCRIGNCVPQCFMENSSEGANAGIENCAISPTGDVRPDNLSGYVFGNLYEQSIEEIWQSKNAQWYRNQVPKECHACVELSRCRGSEKSVAIEHGFEKDRLMREPIRESKEETLVFDPDMKPVPYYTVRKEPFGYLLARYNWSVPVSADAKPILDAIDGDNTLAQLKNQFGDEALDFVGYLYREGFVHFNG